MNGDEGYAFAGLDGRGWGRGGCSRHTMKGVEGEIQAKHSYGGGCRACCLTEWSGRPKGGGWACRVED